MQVCHGNNTQLWDNSVYPFTNHHYLKATTWLCPEPLCQRAACPEVAMLWGTQSSQKGQVLMLQSAVLGQSRQPMPDKWAMRGQMIPISSCQATPSFWVFPTKNVAHRPTAPFPNPWPTESMNVIKCWLFYLNESRVVYYTAIELEQKFGRRAEVLL